METSGQEESWQLGLRYHSGSWVMKDEEWQEVGWFWDQLKTKEKWWSQHWTEDIELWSSGSQPLKCSSMWLSSWDSFQSQLLHGSLLCLSDMRCWSYTMLSDGGPSLSTLQAAWKEVMVCSTVNLLVLCVGWPCKSGVSLPPTSMRKLGCRQSSLFTHMKSRLGFHTYLPEFLLKLLTHLKCLNILGILQNI